MEDGALLRMPPLIKGYLRAGAYICGEPAWDADFNTADMFLLLPMASLSPRYAQHFRMESRRATRNHTHHPAPFAGPVWGFMLRSPSCWWGWYSPRQVRSCAPRIVRWWSRKLLRILRVVLDVNDTRRTGRRVILSSSPSHFVAGHIHHQRGAANPLRGEIRDPRLALCRLAVRRTGTIFIKRAKRSDTHKINQVMHDVLAGGDCVGLFPEGTTSAGDRVRKFHSSLFEPAVASGALVTPVALEYRLDSGARQPGTRLHRGHHLSANPSAQFWRAPN